MGEKPSISFTFRRGSPHGTGSVSYTHLDVYKRQVYRSASADTMQSLYVANPALAGGVLGGLLFALLTLCDCARTSRCRVEALCDAAV